MHDLGIAKKRLSEKGITLSIVKSADVIFESPSHGVSGFLEAVEKLGDKLEDASAADRVVGKAVALLCVYARIKAVYALTLSKKAKVVFEKYAVPHEGDNLVENILDASKVGTCPFEELAMKISDPAEGYERLKALQRSLATR